MRRRPTEITEEKHSQHELRKSEKRFRRMAENIDEVFWMQDAETHELIYVNPAVEAIWEEPVETFYKDSEAWLDRIHPDDRQAVKSAFETAKRDGFDVNYRIVTDEGEKWVHD
ncbi:MAG: PAS domain-containing protein, partial [bacterium]